MKCDFEGYVTKNDVRCMDGRIIRKDAFKENDKMSVPLVWQHRHDSPENVLGHMELENREDGVYGYGFFNNTDMANTARELVANKDIRNMSIYANHLIEKDKNVTHGSIKEVSLVLAGANPGAVINHVSIAHSDGFVTEIDDECDIFTDEVILYHADEDEEEDTIEDANDTDEDEVEEISHADEEPEENQNAGNFGKAFSEMTKADYESLLADLDEMEVMLDDFDQILDGKKIKHDAFEEDDELALIHYASPYYDPVYAHEYYMAHRKLKGRQRSAYSQLNKEGRKQAKNYKDDRNHNRDIDINKSAEATKRNIEKINASTKKRRAELKNKTLKDIKDLNSGAKEAISDMRQEYYDELSDAKTDAEVKGIVRKYKLFTNEIRKAKNEVANSLIQAYSKDSKALTSESKSKRSSEKNKFDKTKLKEMTAADNDYTDYVERLTTFGDFIKGGYVKINAHNGPQHIEKFGIEKVGVATGGEKYINKANRGSEIDLDNNQTYNYNARHKLYDNLDDAMSGKLDDKDYEVLKRANSKQVWEVDSDGRKKIKHSDSDSEVLEHSDSDETVADILNTLDEKQKKVAAYIIGMAIAQNEDKDLAQDDFEFDFNDYISHEDGSEETVGDIFETFNEKQKNCVYYLVSQALENNENIEHSDEGGNDFMIKHNIFENDQEETNVLTHADFSEIIADAKKSGSLKDVFLAHAGADYGFGPYTSDRDSSYDGKYGPTEGIDVLFPDARLVDKKIEMLRNNPTDWVVKVMNGVHKSPFSRIKMIYADITGEDARAKGYITGHQKVSEVIALLHRTTAPTTIYKLQKLDRDDIIDITDFDIVAWLKAEMRIMLEEEIARQILVGDFRSSASSDRIDPNCVRPILTDTSNDLYAMRYSYAVGQTENEYEKFIDECCLAMIDYEGTGSPTLYTTPEYVGHMLLVKDTLGNRIYKTKGELASACGVKEIVEVPYMKDQTRTEGEGAGAETFHSMGFTDASGNNCLCKGIIVNLTDYTVGADKGGAVNMFDDFDIDFNKYTYLIETKISGSLTKPKSAIVIGVQQA